MIDIEFFLSKVFQFYCDSEVDNGCYWGYYIVGGNYKYYLIQESCNIME